MRMLRGAFIFMVTISITVRRGKVPSISSKEIPSGGENSIQKTLRRDYS